MLIIKISPAVVWRIELKYLFRYVLCRIISNNVESEARGEVEENIYSIIYLFLLKIKLNKECGVSIYGVCCELLNILNI